MTACLKRLVIQFEFDMFASYMIYSSIHFSIILYMFIVRVELQLYGLMNNSGCFSHYGYACLL